MRVLSKSYSSYENYTKNYPSQTGLLIRLEIILTNLRGRVNRVSHKKIAAGYLVWYSIYTYYDYKTHPGLYEMQSAPWYAAIQANVILFLITALVIFAIRWILRKKYGELLNS